MKVYHYHPETKEYAGFSDAKLDPLESTNQNKDVYLIPANATTDPPPELKDGYARCFYGGVWVHIEDHRGEKMFSTIDAHENSMVALGHIPEGYTLSVPPEDYPKWNEEKKEWEVDNVKAAEAEKAALNTRINETLSEIDWKSIRALRAILCAQLEGSTPDPLDVQYIKQREGEAVVERSKREK